MKKLIVAICCSAIVAQYASAQENSATARKYEKQQTMNQTDQMNQSDKATQTKHTKSKHKTKSKLISSKKIVGTYIYGPNDESIADVNSIMLDKNGKVAQVIVGVGGLAGVAETEIAVPWQAFDCKCEVKDGEKCCRISLPMTAEQLKKAPSLEAKEYAELYDQNWLKTNAKFYNVDTTASAPKRGSLMCVTEISGLQLTGEEAMRTAASNENEKTYTSSKSDSTNNADDADLGTIEEVVFDIADQKACYIIVGDDSGLVSERHFAVPFSKIKFSKKDGKCCAEIAASASDLKTAPRVTPGECNELDLESVRKKVDDSFVSR